MYSGYAWASLKMTKVDLTLSVPESYGCCPFFSGRDLTLAWLRVDSPTRTLAWYILHKPVVGSAAEVATQATGFT